MVRSSPLDEGIDSKVVYLQLLQSLQRIRECAGAQLNLAQICVVGDQSSGKSSLLSTCTGIYFPEDAGVCTRVPVVVECKSADTATRDEYFIQNRLTGKYDSCANLEALRERITVSQKGILDALRKNSQQIRERAEDTTQKGLSLCKDAEGMDTSEIQPTKRYKAAVLSNPGPSCPAVPVSEKSEMSNYIRGCPTISTCEIRVRVVGPTQINIIVIDLPGIIHNGPGAAETRGLIQRYCQPKQTLILLVSEAKQDVESIEAIALAGKYDPQGSRTLRVLTKFDVFDSEKAKERAHNWIRRAAANNLDGLGCHAVVCRVSGGDKHVPEKEMEWLQGLPASHCGVEALKKRLPELFARFIALALPGLNRQIIQKLEATRNSLFQIGYEPASNRDMLRQFLEGLPDSAEFERLLTPHHDAFEEAVRGTASKITKEWTDSKFMHNKFRLPMFQGEDAVMSCMREIADEWWMKPLKDYIAAVGEACLNSLKPDRHALVSDRFWQVASRAWTGLCNVDILKLCHVEFDKVRKQQRGFGTANHCLEAKYREAKVLPEELRASLSQCLPSKIQEFTEAYSKELEDYRQTQQSPRKNGIFGETFAGSKHFAEPTVPLTVQERTQNYLKQEVEIWVMKYEQSGLFDQQRCCIFDAVKALWTVEHKTFIDVVLKVTRDAVIKRREDWIHFDIHQHKTIIENAVEDPDTAAMRERLKKDLANLEDCLQELQKIKTC